MTDERLDRNGSAPVDLIGHRSLTVTVEGCTELAELIDAADADADIGRVALAGSDPSASRE